MTTYNPEDELDVEERLDLDNMPDEALARLIAIEVPALYPRFGLLPDVAAGPELSLEDLRRRVFSVLDEPVQVHPWRKDKKVIQVLRKWILVVWAGGRISALKWHASGCGQINLEPAHAKTLDLFHFATRNNWLLSVASDLGWEFAHANQNDEQAWTLKSRSAQSNRVYQDLSAEVDTHVRAVRLDARIRDQMGLDESVMRWAISLMGLKRSPGGSDVLLPAYNWVVEHRKDLETLQRQAPELVQWLPVYTQDLLFSSAGRIRQSLRDYLTTRDVGRIGWLLLLRHGRRLLAEASHLWGSELSKFGLDNVRSHAQLGRGGLIPAQLFRLLCEHLGAPNWIWDDNRDVPKALVACWKKQPPVCARELEDWRTVLIWLRAAGRAFWATRPPRSAALPYFLARAQLWLDAEKHRRLDFVPHLGVWHEPLQYRDWQLQFMRPWQRSASKDARAAKASKYAALPLTLDTLVAQVMFEGQPLGRAWFQRCRGSWELRKVQHHEGKAILLEQYLDIRQAGRQIDCPVYCVRGQA